jgi:membrane protease YdiL (CAAX protease family)
VRPPSTDQDRVAGWSTVVVGTLVSGVLLTKNVLLPGRVPSSAMGFTEYYLFNIALLLLPALLLILLGLRRDVAEFGFQSGELRGGVIAALIGFALFVPVLLLVAPQPAFQSYYLRNLLAESGVVTNFTWQGNQIVGGTIDWGRLAFHELVLGMYMLAWEWFFRGFLLFGARRAFPTWAAALIQAVLFCALHWGKPPIEVASSLPGGLILAAAAIRFQSFLPCFLIHFLISAGFDMAVLFYHFR